ncbi:MAG: DUF1573 domain-containing protein [Isosphaeraceae bacterium]|nr:DUF1573 domain-containing protein [Isosphaeraceae bacterium]
MKRWLILAVLVVGLSAAIPLVLSVLPTASTANINEPIPAPVQVDGPVPKVVLDEDTTYHFGTMAQEQYGTHTWTVKNEGPGVLELKKGGSTCSCTIANLAEGDTTTVQPGETTQIKLTWETRMNNGLFEKSADILTNDPARPRITFIVTGTVQPALIFFPPTPGNIINFGTIPNDQTPHSDLALTSPDRPDLKIESITVSNPERVKVTTRPLTDEEKASLNMDSGYRLIIEVHPGRVLGNFQDEVTIKTDHPTQPEAKLTVSGRISGPITVLPGQFLRFPPVASRQGDSESVVLVVRGQATTQFEVAEAPKMLKVVVEPDDVKTETDSFRRYRMTVTIPPGTPSGEINGTIVLKTDHPLASEVKIPVFALVEEG